MTQYDAIVVGAGHNGLTNAAYLARSGLKVLRARAQSVDRRRGGEPRARERLDLLQLLVCLQPAAARAVPRSRAGAARPAGRAVRRRRHDHQQRRHPRQLHRPRRPAPRIRAAQRARRRCLRPLFDGCDAPVQVHPPAAAAHAAGSDFVQAARHPRADLSRQGVREARRAGHLRHDPFLFDEHRRLPGRVLRVRSHQGAPVGQRHHRLGAWACIRPAPLTCCCITTWATSTARSARGASRAAAWARSRKRMASAFKSYGGEIVTDAPVEQVIVRGGKVTGVASTNGNEYHAKIVVSNLDPKRTFTKLFDEKDLRSRVRQAREELQDPRLLGQAQHRARRVAGIPRARQGQPACASATCTSSTRSRRWSAPTTTGRTAPGRRSPTSTC